MVYRVADVCKLFQISKPTLYKLLKSGIFPKPIRLSKRLVIWTAEDIEQFLEAQRKKK